MSGKEWNGNERRSSVSDHDILLKIDANLDSFMKQFEEHKKEDNIRFDKLDKRTGWIEKCVYMASGVIVFIEAFWKK